MPSAHDLTLKHFLDHGLHELTHFDSKIFRTLKTLVLYPGKLTADYLAGRRLRYVMPLRLFLVIFAISFFLYSRPGVALYDIHTIITASPQGKMLDGKIDRFAEKRHLSKDVVVDKFNEHWQHDVSFFQLGDVFCFAICLAILNRHRYFVEHVIFSLHALSFTLLYGCFNWLYYVHYGFTQNWTLVFASAVIYFVYLWKAVPQVYGGAGWKAAMQALLLTIGLEFSRIFFMTFTMMLATIQTFR